MLRTRMGCTVLVVFTAAAAAMAAKEKVPAPKPIAPRLERPTGEYARWVMKLPGAFAVRERKKERRGDVTLFVWTRGRRAVQATAVSPTGQFNCFREADLAALKAEADGLTGAVRFGAHYELKVSANWPNVWFELRLDASTDGERLSGSYTGTCALASAARGKELTVAQIEAKLADDRKAAAIATKGKLAGTRHAGEAYAKAESIAPGVGWPSWLGPTGNLHGQDAGRPLEANLSKARLVWRCEQGLLPGKAQVTRYGGFGFWAKKPSGGGASPVLADGKLYLYYYVPAGEAYLKAEEKKRAPKGYFLKDMWRLRADDVVLCIDAATGRTLWKTTFPLAGRTFLTGKSNLINNTAAVAEGTVVAYGSAGRAYALDAETGELRWQGVVEHDYRDAMRDLSRGRPGGGRSHPHAVTIADGVATVGNLAAFDLKTGEALWTKRRALGRFASPCVWRHGGKTRLLIFSNDGVLSCVEPRTGKAAWTLAGLGHRKWGNETPFLHGDYLLVSVTKEADIKVGKEPAHRMACYRLWADGAKRLWDLPNDRYAYPVHSAGNGSIVRLDDTHAAFANGRTELVVVEVATGKVVDREAISREADEKRRVTWNAPTFVHADDVLLGIRDNWHCRTEFLTFGVRGGQVSLFGGPCALPHWPATSYEVPMICPLVDGRLFIRGAVGLYCYDLR